jgi:hypothetical protein
MKVTKLHENIYYYTDVFENAKEMIDVLEELENDSTTYKAISAWQDDSCDRMRKDLMYELKEQGGPQGAKLIEDLKSGINKVAHAFFQDRGLDGQPNISPMLDMCKYVPGGHLGFHYDGIDGDRSLLYTIVMYFNDDYEGGEISFTVMDDSKQRPSSDLNDPNIDFWVKPKAGSVLVFPSQAPYYHQAHEVKSGYKYMSTSSIFIDGYDAFNPEHIKKYRGL